MSRPFGARNRKYRPRHTSACKWCGATFSHVGPDTETCRPECRHRLRQFRDALGFDPDRPYPDTTGAEAVALVIARLVEVERIRRSADHTTTHHPCG